MGRLYEDIVVISEPVVEVLGLVEVSVLRQVDGSINETNYLHAISSQVCAKGSRVDQSSVDLEVLRAVVGALIDVNCIKRDASSMIKCYSLLNVRLIVTLVRGLLPSEGPERWQLWLANETMVLLDDLLGRAMDEEVDLNLTT